jgi:hypothetical protein
MGALTASDAPAGVLTASGAASTLTAATAPQGTLTAATVAGWAGFPEIQDQAGAAIRDQTGNSLG